MESLYEKSLTLLLSNFETMGNTNILKCELVKNAHSLVLIYAPVLSSFTVFHAYGIYWLCPFTSPSHTYG